MPSKNPYYTNSSLRKTEHRVVDASNFQEFTDNICAFRAEHTTLGDIIVSGALFQKIITTGEFASYFDPVSKFENIERGFIGTIHGHHIFTDTYMDLSDPERIFADGGKRPQMILLQQEIPTAD